MSYFNTYYAVQVNAVVGSGSYDGFIDNMKVEQYMVNGAIPGTLNNSTVKTQGNLRYKQILQQLDLMGNIYVFNAVANGATVNSVANSFTFYLKVEQGDNVLRTKDELSSNGYVLYGYQAIERCVARGMNQAQLYTQTVYDPTSTTAPSNGSYTSNAVRVGERIMVCNVAALTNSLVNANNYIGIYTANNYIAPSNYMYPSPDWPIIP
jgi:hypothetical protein